MRPPLIVTALSNEAWWLVRLYIIACCCRSLARKISIGLPVLTPLARHLSSHELAELSFAEPYRAAPYVNLYTIRHMMGRAVSSDAKCAAVVDIFDAMEATDQKFSCHELVDAMGPHSLLHDMSSFVNDVSDMCLLIRTADASGMLGQGAGLYTMSECIARSCEHVAPQASVTDISANAASDVGFLDLMQAFSERLKQQPLPSQVRASPTPTHARMVGWCSSSDGFVQNIHF